MLEEVVQGDGLHNLMKCVIGQKRHGFLADVKDAALSFVPWTVLDRPAFSLW